MSIVDYFDEISFSRSWEYYNLFLGVNISWNHSDKKRVLGVYSCQKLIKGSDLEEPPEFVVVRSSTNFEIFKVPQSVTKYKYTPSYWDKNAKIFTQSDISDAVVNAYYSAENSNDGWKLLRPRYIYHSGPDYDEIYVRVIPETKQIDKQSTNIKLESRSQKSHPDYYTENYYTNIEQRKVLADRFDTLLTTYKNVWPIKRDY